MFTIKVTGMAQVTRKFDKLAKADLRKGVTNGIEKSCRLVEANVKSQQLSGNPVKVRSGRLRSSVRTQINTGRLEGRVGTNVVYAPIIEDGGTIRPVKAKVLAVPLKAAKTAAGRSRGGPRDFPGGFWMKRKGWRNPIFFQKHGKKLVALFVGLRKVRIKARKPFERAARATGVGVVRNLSDNVARAIRNA